MARSRRRSASNPLVSFFSRDPFGVTAFSVLYLVVLIAKWWYIAPPSLNADSCLGCVTAVLVVIAMLVTAPLTAFWILWLDKRQKKNVLFVFLITLLVLGVAVLLDFLLKEIFSQLYFRGLLRWHETDITYLLDDFLPHCAGLYLGVLMLYAMLRMAFDPGFSPRKYVIPINLVFMGVAAFLLLIGIMLY